MTVWTISAQEGTGADQVASTLASAAGVPLLDRAALALLAHDLDPAHLEASEFGELELRCGRLSTLALSIAITTGPAAIGLLQELHFRRTLPELGRAILGEAARQSCVILAPAAFAALPHHPEAIHVRLRAPLRYRVETYQREHLVDRRRAEKEIRHDDHVKRTWVRSLYQVEIDDSRLFSLLVDAARFSSERLVETLLAAGGTLAAVTAPL